MADDLSQRHLGTLHAIHQKGKVPRQKSDVNLLVKRGLVEAAGPRGQYGMTEYRATDAGRSVARNVVLSEGQFRIAQGEAESAAPAPTDEVPPGHMRMKNGKILKIAKG